MRPGSSLLRSAALCALPLCLWGCRLGASVVRIEDGQQVEGRWISPDAYASFLEGALAEEGGNRAAAIAHYREALAEDPAAGEAWARLGAIQCKNDRKAADAAFSRARSLDPGVGGVWLAIAECDLERNDAAKARVSAGMALRTNPKSPEASRILAEALERASDHEGAARVRRGYRLISQRPDSTTEPDPEAAFDSGDASGTEKARHGARVPLAEVALRAVRAGQVQRGGELAFRVLRAEPGNTDALIAVLAARDLGWRTGSEFADDVAQLPADRSALSPLARELMTELLARRAGKAAAEAFGAAR